MDECVRELGYLICIARYHPTFYSTLVAAVLAALFAYFSIRMNRKSAREKNSVDFEHNYKNSDKVKDAWLVLMKLTQNRLQQPMVYITKYTMAIICTKHTEQLFSTFMPSHTSSYKSARNQSLVHTLTSVGFT